MPKICRVYWQYQKASYKADLFHEHQRKEGPYSSLRMLAVVIAMIFFAFPAEGASGFWLSHWYITESINLMSQSLNLLVSSPTQNLHWLAYQWVSTLFQNYEIPALAENKPMLKIHRPRRNKRTRRGNQWWQRTLGELRDVWNIVFWSSWSNCWCILVQESLREKQQIVDRKKEIVAVSSWPLNSFFHSNFSTKRWSG